MKHPQHIVAVQKSRFGAMTEGLNIMTSEEVLTRATDSLIIGRREELEADESCGQLLPYILFHRKNDAGELELFTYRRGKGIGENRLLGKYSLGIGGHIDIGDVSFRNNIVDVFDTLGNAVERELSEEICFSNEKGKKQTSHVMMVGVINDNSDAVGRVHTGVLIAIDLPQGASITTTEPELETIGMVSIEEAGSFDLESWSRIVVDNIDKIKTVIEG